MVWLVSLVLSFVLSLIQSDAHILMLIFSFRYGFNPGSTLMISTAQLGDVASLVAVNTTLGAAGGALSGMFTSTIVDERKTGIYS